MKPARAAALVTWVYAAGFGVPTVPVAVFLLTQGRLPSFGFALPLPWPSGIARAGFLAIAWKSLAEGHSSVAAPAARARAPLARA